MVSLDFVETTVGSRVTAYVPCEATDFAFDTVLAPGTWRTLGGPYTDGRSNLPSGTFLIDPALSIAGPTAGAKLDIKTVPARGVVRHDGQVPAVGPDCTSATADMVTVSFTDPDAPVGLSLFELLNAVPTTDVTTYVLCSATDFSFAADVPPGVYRVSVSPYTTGRSNLPDGTFVIAPRLEIR
jgi:hypothetical protein